MPKTYNLNLEKLIILDQIQPIFLLDVERVKLNNFLISQYSPKKMMLLNLLQEVNTQIRATKRNN